MNPKIYYRVLQTDGEVFKKLRNYYDGFVIEASILEQFTKFTLSLLFSVEKPFFIDPTHKLVLLTLKEKEWAINVAEAFKISECVEEGVILIDKLKENLDAFVKATIAYQRDKIKMSSGGLELFGISGYGLEPGIIVAPYFLIEGIHSESFELNLEMLRKSIALKGDGKLYAVIAIEEYLLSEAEELISKFEIEGVDGFCVWVSDFREEGEDVKMLEKYVEFFKKLSKLKKPIMNLYGGAFSVLLGKLGLIDCVVQGIAYGEHRNPYIAATGRYTKTYYIPKIHKVVPLYRAQELIETVPELKCECEFCVEADIMNTPENRIRTDLLKKHYVLSRWNEKQMDFNELYANLKSTTQLLDDVFEEFWEQLRHLKSWEEVIGKIIEG